MDFLKYKRTTLLVLFIAVFLMASFKTVNISPQSNSLDSGNVLQQHNTNILQALTNKSFTQTNPTYTGSVPNRKSEYNLSNAVASFSSSFSDKSGNGLNDSGTFALTFNLVHNGSLTVDFYVMVSSNVTGNITTLHKKEILITNNAVTDNFYYTANQNASYTFNMQVFGQGALIGNSIVNQSLYEPTTYLTLNPSITTYQTDNTGNNNSFDFAFDYNAYAESSENYTVITTTGTVNVDNSLNQTLKSIYNFQGDSQRSYSNTISVFSNIQANVSATHYIEVNAYINSTLVYHYNTTIDLQPIQPFFTQGHQILSQNEDHVTGIADSIYYQFNFNAAFSAKTNITYLVSIVKNNGVNTTLNSTSYQYDVQSYSSVVNDNYFYAQQNGTYYCNITIFVNGVLNESYSEMFTLITFINNVIWKYNFNVAGTSLSYTSWFNAWLIDGGSLVQNLTAVDNVNQLVLFSRTQTDVLSRPLIQTYTSSLNGNTVIPTTGVTLIMNCTYVNSTGYTQSMYNGTYNTQNKKYANLLSKSGAYKYNSSVYFLLPFQFDLVGFGTQNVTLQIVSANASNIAQTFNLSYTYLNSGLSNIFYPYIYELANGTFNIKYYVYVDGNLFKSNNIGTYTFFYFNGSYILNNPQFSVTSTNNDLISASYMTASNDYFLQSENVDLLLKIYYFDTSLGNYRYLITEESNTTYSGYQPWGFTSDAYFNVIFDGNYIIDAMVIMNGTVLYQSTFTWNNAVSQLSFVNHTNAISISPYYGFDTNNQGIVSDTYFDPTFDLTGGPYNIQILIKASIFNYQTNSFVLQDTISRNETYFSYISDEYYLGTGYFANKSGFYLFEYEIMVNGILYSYDAQTIQMAPFQTNQNINSNFYPSYNNGYDLEYNYNYYFTNPTAFSLQYTLYYTNSTTNSIQVVSANSINKTVIGGDYVHVSLPTQYMSLPEGYYNLSYVFYINNSLSYSDYSDFNIGSNPNLANVLQLSMSPQITENNYFTATGNFISDYGLYNIQIDGVTVNSSQFYTGTTFNLQVGSLSVGTHTLALNVQNSNGNIMQQSYPFVVLQNSSPSTNTTPTTSPIISTISGPISSSSSASSSQTSTATKSTTHASPGFEILIALTVLIPIAIRRRRK